MTANQQYFISYSQTDSAAFVRKLAMDLKSREYRIWLDQLDIKAGETWDTAIQQALDAADSILVVLSKNSVASKNVMDEVSYALTHEKTVIPILTEDCKIPFRLARIQHIDFRKSYEQGLDQLIDTLHEGPAMSETPSPTVASKKRWKYGVYGLIGLALIIAVFLLTRESPFADAPNVNSDSSLSSYSITKGNPLILGWNGYLVRYRIAYGSIRLYITALDNSVPRIIFDVNQNGKIDPYVDRYYSVAANGTNKICSGFILSDTSETSCASAPSEAELVREDNVWTFSIPLQEVRPSGSRRIVLELAFFAADSTPIYFPKRDHPIDFNSVYLVDI